MPIKRKVDGRSSAAKKVGKKESLLSKHVKRLKKDGTGKSSLRELKIAAKKHGIDLTGLKKGGMAKSSAQTSVIKGASVGGSREGSVIKGPASKGSREGSVIKAKDGKWIQKAIKKPGSLRRALGVKKGKDIPAKKLTTAAKKKGKIGQRARLAQTLKGFKR